MPQRSAHPERVTVRKQIPAAGANKLSGINHLFVDWMRFAGLPLSNKVVWNLLN
jgi:hypothetical protein